MRQPRLKAEGTARYHVVTRTVAGEFLLDTREKRRISATIRAVERFSGVHILTHAILTTHVHMVVKVPERQEVSDEELIRRLRYIYDERRVVKVAEQMRELRQADKDNEAEDLKASYTYRMYDLSEFMKNVNQRISQSYNKRHNRHGTIWAGRFRSLLMGVSRCGDKLSRPLPIVAAYVDLNPVRAGIVDDPADYHFCGYTDALRGGESARRGIEEIVEVLTGNHFDWQEAHSAYRELLDIRAGSTMLRTRIPQLSGARSLNSIPPEWLRLDNAA